MSPNRKVAVIGAGFGGLSAAASLAKKGFKVTVFEKNNQPGGRAGLLEKDGFKFDTGPSWFMMPEVFERFFASFDQKMEDYFQIKRLDPAYRIYFDKDDYIDVPSNISELAEIFESIEKGSGKKLRSYLKACKQMYDLAFDDVLYTGADSLKSLLKPNILLNKRIIMLLKDFHKFNLEYFSNPKLLKIVEWMITFVGNSPFNSPALYALMNHAQFDLGIFYPVGGFYEVSKGLEQLCMNLGVEIKYNEPVEKLNVKSRVVESVKTSKGKYEFDAVISNADYAFTELNLLDKQDRVYKKDYWEKKVYSPSVLLFFLGFDEKVKKLEHHNMIFDRDSDWEGHFSDVYDKIKWPKDPMFYINIPSKNDQSVAPEGKENMVILTTVAAGLKDDRSKLKESYLKQFLDRIEKLTGQHLHDKIVTKEIYSVSDFQNLYNSHKGHAFGLAHTLDQTAFLRPNIKHKKIKNLFFSGCTTNPGISVPLSLISGEVAADMLVNLVDFN